MTILVEYFKELDTPSSGTTVCVVVAYTSKGFHNSKLYKLTPDFQ